MTCRVCLCARRLRAIWIRANLRSASVIFRTKSCSAPPASASTMFSSAARFSSRSLFVTVYLFRAVHVVCHVPVVCGGRPSPPSPMSLEYINRFPAKLAIVFRNRPLSLSLRSLNRNACSSKYRNKMKRFNVYISPANRPLEQRPEIFQSVSVDVAFRIALRMINYVVDVFVTRACSTSVS